jgi:hypothetical protein
MISSSLDRLKKRSPRTGALGGSHVLLSPKQQ